MQKYEKVTMPRKKIIINNFIGGIAWGLGATIGLSIVFAFLGFLASKINFIPVIGEFVSDLLNYVLNNNPRLK